MATDPATTPLTFTGQAIFGVGVGVLTVLDSNIHELLRRLNFGTCLMNLTVPLLDNVGLRKTYFGKENPKLPKAKQFETTVTVDCIRCGECMLVCCHNLSPILIKEAFDKTTRRKLKT